MSCILYFRFIFVRTFKGTRTPKPKDPFCTLRRKYAALFAERMVEKGLAGVIYPSVRTGGDGFNVAIHPDYVKSSMRLSAVSECTVYKKGKKTIVDNETIAHLKEGEEHFTLEPVQSKYHIGREKALQEINQ